MASKYKKNAYGEFQRNEQPHGMNNVRFKSIKIPHWSSINDKITKPVTKRVLI